MEAIAGILKSLGFDPEEALEIISTLLTEIDSIKAIAEENNRILRFLLRRTMAIEEWEEEQVRGGEILHG